MIMKENNKIYDLKSGGGELWVTKAGVTQAKNLQ